jgi:hypothetical protein
MDIIIDTGHFDPATTTILFDTDTPTVLPADTTWADLLAEQFGSRSQVRREGFNEIPYGWTDRYIGKMRTRYCIWKPAPVVWDELYEAAYVDDWIERRFNNMDYFEQYREASAWRN